MPETDSERDNETVILACFGHIKVAIALARLGSLSREVANSFSIRKVDGAELTKLAIDVDTLDTVA